MYTTLTEESSLAEPDTDMFPQAPISEAASASAGGVASLSVGSARTYEMAFYGAAAADADADTGGGTHSKLAEGGIAHPGPVPGPNWGTSDAAGTGALHEGACTAVDSCHSPLIHPLADASAGPAIALQCSAVRLDGSCLSLRSKDPDSTMHRTAVHLDPTTVPFPWCERPVSSTEEAAATNGCERGLLPGGNSRRFGLANRAGRRDRTLAGCWAHTESGGGCRNMSGDKYSEKGADGWYRPVGCVLRVSMAQSPSSWPSDPVWSNSNSSVSMPQSIGSDKGDQLELYERNRDAVSSS